MRGHIASLNAAVAGSVVLYEIWRQRGWAMPAEAAQSE
jgi:tRNA G18 (ribose-2'-O)-methylase SpoU